VTAGTFGHLLWTVAVLAGWLAVICLIGGWYARRKFRLFLKAPLSDEVAHLTHVWEKRVERWTTLGVLMSGLSILCVIGWLLSGQFAQ
jgi:hypothetical protein